MREEEGQIVWIERGDSEWEKKRRIFFEDRGV